MNSNKVILGGVAGGVAFFLLGFVIYGLLLMDFMKANTDQSTMRPEEDFIWWAMILSNLITGFLYALIFKWSNTTGMAEGAKTGAIIGFMTCLAFDLMLYSMSTMYSTTTVLVVDVIGYTVMSAIAGAVIGWVMNMGAAKATS